MDTTTASTWVEVDLAAIRSNVRALTRLTSAKVMAIVKGNAYGHGLVPVGQATLEGGAAWLGVARLEEAQQLRAGGVRSPIMAMTYTHPSRAGEAAADQITLAAYDPDLARQLSAQAHALGVTVAVHAKVDTGMSRLGVMAEDGVEFLRLLRSLPGLEVTGLFTHFARGDDKDHPANFKQLERFQALISALEAANLRPPTVHCCATAAALFMPQAHFDMVRPGIAIYGLQCSDDARLPGDFRPALTWKARLVSVKTLPAGQGVGYHYRYTTQSEERVGVIAAGYGDGFRRRTGNFALLGGKRVNVLGGMCADQCIISLQELPEARVGDEAVLIGRQGQAEIPAEEVAKAWNTTNYEVVCGITARVPRFYR